MKRFIKPFAYALSGLFLSVLTLVSVPGMPWADEVGQFAWIRALGLDDFSGLGSMLIFLLVLCLDVIWLLFCIASLIAWKFPNSTNKDNFLNLP